jgi:nucleoside 2-deoxyribosyltransferase
MKIYLAGPLFNKAEKEFNQILCDKLESAGFSVFLPQRDGVEKDKSPYNTTPIEERRVTMFNLNKEKIFDCDIFLFVLDGRVPDEGACVELGLAYTYRELTKSKKTLVGLHTDIRAAFLGSKINPMIRVPMDYIAENETNLIEFLSQCTQNRKK